MCPLRFEIIETTWQEVSDERPSFTKIVHVLESSIRKASFTHEESFAGMEEDENNNYIELIAQ